MVSANPLENASTAPKFRRDIHGLRGVSVLLVVLFHFGVPGFKGGFLGVDIFFVISGYLITMLLLREASISGHFNLKNFYLRRLKRILPAALLVLLIFGVIGAWLFPSRAAGFAEEMRWNAVALGNVNYAAQSDYFAVSAEEFLFLNYWSLAVEEQFYLIWPILVIVALKIPPRFWRLGSFGFGLFLVAITSLAWTSDAYNFGFYQLIGRGWELVAGGGLAVWEIRRKTFKLDPIILVAISVLLLILALSIEQMSIAPSALIAMILTVVSTLLFISAGNTKTLMLSNPVLQFFGSISYSLYLVHWPLKTLVFLFIARPLLPLEIFFCFLASVILSMLLHYGIENPMRFKRWRAKPLIISSTFALSTLFGTSYLTIKLPYLIRLETTEPLTAYNEVRGRLQKKCLVSGKAAFPGFEACRFGAEGRETIDLWLVGDSHAEHWQAGLEDLALRYNLTGVLYAKSARLPVFNIQQILYRDKVQTEVDQWRENYETNLLKAAPATVIISARWGLYVQTKSSGPDGGKRYYVTRAEGDEHSVALTQKIISEQLERTVRELQTVGHKVVLLGQIPELGVSKIDCVMRANENEGAQESCYPKTADVTQFLEPSKDILQEISNKTGAIVIFPDETLCDAKTCTLLDGTTYLYRDDDHLNKRGSVIVANRLAGQLLSTFSNR